MDYQSLEALVVRIMATIEEVLAKVNQLLTGLETRFFGGISGTLWGEPADFSLLVRQDQPPSSGSSQFAIEDLPLSTYQVAVRQTADVVAVSLGVDQVLGRSGSGDIGGIDLSTIGGSHDVLSATHSDTLAASVVLGDVVHGNATPKWARLTGNITTTKKFLSQTGTGSVSAVPAWEAIVGGDLPAHTHTESEISDHADYVLVAGDVMSGDLAINRVSNSVYPRLQFRRARGGIAAVQSGDELGHLQYMGYDGVGAYRTGAIVEAQATETWTASAAGAKLVFYATPDATIVSKTVLELLSVASAVNYLEIANAATAGDLNIAAVGDDANITLQLIPKGAGDLYVELTTGNMKVHKGGETLEFSAVSLNASANLSIIAGDQLFFIATGGTIGFTGDVEYSANVTIDGNLTLYGDFIQPQMYNATAGTGSLVKMSRARGSQVSPSEVLSGDTLSIIESLGHDGSAFETGARIDVTATENWSEADHGTDMLFSVVGDGSITENSVLNLTGVASAVNYLQLTNAATVNDLQLDAVGSDTNIGIVISGKGTGIISTPSQIKSNVSMGTKPFIVSSNTLNDLLNADLLDGSHATAFALSTLVNALGSSGWLSGGVVTDGGGNTVDVALGTGLFRATDDETVLLQEKSWGNATGLSVPVDTVRCIGVELIGGVATPIVEVTQDAFDNTTKWELAIVINEGGTIHIDEHRFEALNHAWRDRKAFEEIWHIQRAHKLGGLMLSETGTRNVFVSGGVFQGVNRHVIDDVDTSGSDTLDRYYRDGGGGWTAEFAETQWPNMYYDDGSGTLSELTAMKWAVVWAYLETDGDVALVYGQNQYVIAAQAEEDTPPSTLPDRLLQHGTLIGRFIFQKSASTATVQSVYVTVFAASGVTEHDELAERGNATAHIQYMLAATPQLGGDLDVGAFALVDASGNELLDFVTVGSAVNAVYVKNAAIAGNPKIAAFGDDANVSLDLEAQGTGAIFLQSTTRLPTDTELQFRDTAQKICSPSVDTLRIESDLTVEIFIDGKEEVVIVADALTFDAGATDVGFSWATSAQLDFTVGGSSEMCLAADELTFEAGAKDVGFKWGTSGQLDFHIDDVIEMSLLETGLDVVDVCRAASFRADGDSGGVASTVTYTGTSFAVGGVIARLGNYPAGYQQTNTRWIKHYDGTTAGVVPWWPVT